MNIFYLHNDPKQCAIWMNNDHVIKMILETAQLLSTAHVVLDDSQVAYKKTHENHPSAVWARESSANYEWLYQHFIALMDEHQYRFPASQRHAASRFTEALAVVPSNIKEAPRTPIRPAMPDSFKSLYSDPIEAYRMYYSICKRTDKNGKPFKWTNRPKPEWF